MTMKRRIIYLSILVIFSLTGIYMYTEYSRTNKDLLKEKTAFTIDAASLIRAYEQNETRFQQDYTDRVITVRGAIKKIDASENPVVIALGTGEGFSSVQCSMDSTHSKLYSAIKEGQLVALKGIVTGGRSEDLFGTDVIMNRCVVE
jgi:RecJ-like exonuclease